MNEPEMQERRYEKMPAAWQGAFTREEPQSF